jgi:predicted DNA binding CopG/RHH family protein
MEYKLKDGSTLTDAEIENIASEYESGKWKGHLQNVTIVAPDREEATKVVTFRLTESRAAAVKAATKKAGITQSEFYRRAVDRELAAMV